MVSQHQSASDEPALYFSGSLPTNPGDQQARLIRTVKLLGSGVKRMQMIQANTIMQNFEMMAFAISWFGLVCEKVSRIRYKRAKNTAE
jgi:hypothetical protein